MDSFRSEKATMLPAFVSCSSSWGLRWLVPAAYLRGSGVPNQPAMPLPSSLPSLLCPPPPTSSGASLSAPLSSRCRLVSLGMMFEEWVLPNRSSVLISKTPLESASTSSHKPVLLPPSPGQVSQSHICPWTRQGNVLPACDLSSIVQARVWVDAAHYTTCACLCVCVCVCPFARECTRECMYLRAWIKPNSGLLAYFGNTRCNYLMLQTLPALWQEGFSLLLLFLLLLLRTWPWPCRALCPISSLFLAHALPFSYSQRTPVLGILCLCLLCASWT